ncbi:hypothetical protein VTK26DRAFT_3000 [Humicola hyalothermophila]
MASEHEHHHHHHHHDHHHHHGDPASASDQNKDYFNKEAAVYDAKHEKTLDQLIVEIRARLEFMGVDWVDEDGDEDGDGDENEDGGGETKKEKGAARGKSVRLLDYACGTGVVSRALAPYTTQCVGVDLSENMVVAYNARAENQGLSPSEMRAYQGNLCSTDDPSPAAFADPKFFGFDVAVVGLGFHHFEDPALAARRLAERLRVGGVLVVLDFLPHGEPDPSHPATSTITHHGFSEGQIRRIYEDAGVGKDFALQEMATVSFNVGGEYKADKKRRIFMARGVKA